MPEDVVLKTSAFVGPYFSGKETCTTWTSRRMKREGEGRRESDDDDDDHDDDDYFGDDDDDDDDDDDER